MSDRAAAYLQSWVRDNPHEAGNDGTAIVEALLADAHRLGMDRAEFDAAVGDLPAYLAEALKTRMSPEMREQLERGVSDV
jgi:hypothetical protein